MAPVDKAVNGSANASPQTIKADSSPARPAAENKTESEVKTEEQNSVTRPLAPPPRPSEVAQNGEDYFSQKHEQPSNIIFEPNPFEASFSGQVTSSGGDVATPGGTKLPSVAALTSPASLLPGGGGFTPGLGWGGSLRSGPLSPAMLAGPTTGDYFSIRGTYGTGVTPNESSMRTGLTPGGGGSMFPVTTPNSMFQLTNGGATPSTMDFHRTALSAATMQKKNNSTQPQQQNVTSQPNNQPNGVSNGHAERLSHQHPDPFGSGDANDAAIGLFSLAQSQNSQHDGQPPNGYVVAQQQPVHSQQNNHADAPSKGRARNQTGSVSGASQRGGSIGSNAPSDDSEQQQTRPNTRGRNKRAAPAQTNGKRKAEDTPTRGPGNKKAKANGNGNSHHEPEPQSPEEQEQDMTKDEYNSNGKKMTDDEKRKNFLERNRVAALKCRQRKKQWLANLQHRVEAFSQDNEMLHGQIKTLNEEILQLKTLLMAHKDCPLTQQQGIHMESLFTAVGPPPQGEYNGHPMGPDGMYPVPGQHPQMPMNGDMDRRFS